MLDMNKTASSEALSSSLMTASSASSFSGSSMVKVALIADARQSSTRTWRSFMELTFTAKDLSFFGQAMLTQLQPLF